jgi:hypothetical protein
VAHQIVSPMAGHAALPLAAKGAMQNAQQPLVVGEGWIADVRGPYRDQAREVALAVIARPAPSDSRAIRSSVAALDRTGPRLEAIVSAADMTGS